LAVEVINSSSSSSSSNVEAARGASKYIIDRCAASSAKGPRLQRLRAAQFLLDAVTQQENILAYAAVEAEGDVFVATATASETVAYTEEDKNYAEDGAFTFVTPAVINSIVIFADQWLKWQYSERLRFGLYTTVTVGKEKCAGRVKDLAIALPSEPMIELLRSNNFADAALLPCVKALVLDEYARQYRNANVPGHIATLQEWDDSTWMLFLSRIIWLFAEPDEEGAYRRAIDAVRACPFFNERIEGNENLVVSCLLEMFDRRQLAADFSERFIYGAEVALLFKQIDSGEIRRVDPTWRVWAEVAPPGDSRNISEKLLAVCPTLPAGAVAKYQRRTAAGLVELDEHEQDKNVLAMKYQVYDVCDAALNSLVKRASKLSETELEAELEALTALAVKRVAERSQDYSYEYRSESFVRGIVLSLFDSCFLAFDGGS
jgi:hypothetical protein